MKHLVSRPPATSNGVGGCFAMRGSAERYRWPTRARPVRGLASDVDCRYNRERHHRSLNSRRPPAYQPQLTRATERRRPRNRATRCTEDTIRRPKYLLTGLLFAITTAAVAACGDRPAPSKGSCNTTVTSAASPAPGVLTLTGTFSPDESVLLTYTAGGEPKTLVGTPATARTQFTFTGLPSGSVVYDLTISCASGQDERGNRTYFVL